MTGFKKTLATIEAKQFHKKVELENGSTLDIKGLVQLTYNLIQGR